MPLYWTIDSKLQLVVVTAEVARMLGILAFAERPLRLFTSLVPARRWIDGLAAVP